MFWTSSIPWTIVFYSCNFCITNEASKWKVSISNCFTNIMHKTKSTQRLMSTWRHLHNCSWFAANHALKYNGNKIFAWKLFRNLFLIWSEGWPERFLMLTASSEFATRSISSLDIDVTSFSWKKSKRLIIWNVIVSVVKKILWQNTDDFFSFWPGRFFVHNNSYSRNLKLHSSKWIFNKSLGRSNIII